MKKIINRFLFNYRNDIIAILILILALFLVYSVILGKGHIVFSDLDFPERSDNYYDEVFGIWNNRWGSSTQLNIPRFLYLLPYKIVSSPVNSNGSFLLKLFILGIVFTSALSLYYFVKSLFVQYIEGDWNLVKSLAVAMGAFLYGCNPWFIIRIQHIYLLCGYSLLPLLILLFFRLFDQKFLKKNIINFNIFHIVPYKENIKDAFLLGLVFSVMTAAIHYFFYGVIFIIGLWLLILTKYLIIYRNEVAMLKRALFVSFLIKASLLLFFTLIFSFYWLSIYGGGILLGAGATQNNINVADTLDLFSRNSSFFNVLFQQSYWWPMSGSQKNGIIFYIYGSVILILPCIALIKYGFKKHILLFLFILTCLCFVIATGTYYNIFADFFIFLVMEVPFIGNIFRDPNKLIGLALFGLCALLPFGYYALVRLISKYKVISIFMPYIVTVLVVISVFSYSDLWKDIFLNGYYKPIEIPAEYNNLWESGLEVDRILYLPLSEHMISSYGVTTPVWNKNPNKFGEMKATGDFTVYNSPYNTVFHHEGNPTSISYYYRWLIYQLDNGLTDKFGNLVSAAGYSHLDYISGYYSQEKRQQFHTQMLLSDEKLNYLLQDGTFSIFSTPYSDPEVKIDKNMSFMSGGLARLNSLNSISIDSFEMPIFLDHQKNMVIQNIDEGDSIYSSDFTDLFLSQLPDDLLLYPSDHLGVGNASLGWAQSAIHSSDWFWNLKSTGIIDLYDFDLARNEGIAFTISSRKLTIPPHRRDEDWGVVVLDFNSFLRQNLNFVPDNPDIHSIILNPVSTYNTFPSVNGSISKGEPQDIWQVAKSGLISIKENTPYRFRIDVSGRGSNKMHFKARFYDEFGEETGISYLVGPEENIHFNAMSFSGEYVTPPGSKYMRIDLLTFQRSEQKTYWWIHDLEIRDLSEIAEPNIETVTIEREAGDYHIYARVFESRVGGEINFEISDINFAFDSSLSGNTGFKWIDLGVHSIHSNSSISYENIEGFNAINAFAILTTEEELQANYRVELATLNSIQKNLFEAEKDFNIVASLQSERRFPILSNGNASFSYDGKYSRNIDIFRDGEYLFAINGGGYYERDLFQLIISSTNNSEKQIVNFRPENIESGVNLIAEPAILSMPKYWVSRTDVLPNLQQMISDNIFLEKGNYQIEIKVISDIVSTIKPSDFSFFTGNDVLTANVSLPETNLNCSDCESIAIDMVNIITENESLQIEYDATCSCDWYIISSEKVICDSGSEYYIEYNAISENLSQRHAKIVFFDDENRIIGSTFIPEVEEKDKSKTNLYQFYFLVPDKCTSFRAQFWARGTKERGKLLVQNIFLSPSGELPFLDYLYFERINMGLDDVTVHTEPTIQNVVDIPFDKTRITVENPENDLTTLRIRKTYHPLWNLSIDGYGMKSPEYSYLGFYQGYEIDNEGEYLLSFRLSKLYYIGIAIIPICIVLFAFLYSKFNHK